ncbi:hypothetical protein NRIC_24940 [Enterococcus florum]|uniref:Uncharacterized protein n=1 Tax=Enterococcus florum TaxID=2480627 RepID=A0A4P5PN26_9ENTE|nr:hypothetical protein NRIC_24940 [Enterococcus florum]
MTDSFFGTRSAHKHKKDPNTVPITNKKSFIPIPPHKKDTKTNFFLLIFCAFDENVLCF